MGWGEAGLQGKGQGALQEGGEAPTTALWRGLMPQRAAAPPGWGSQGGCAEVHHGQ